MTKSEQGCKMETKTNAINGKKKGLLPQVKHRNNNNFQPEKHSHNNKSSITANPTAAIEKKSVFVNSKKTFYNLYIPRLNFEATHSLITAAFNGDVKKVKHSISCGASIDGDYCQCPLALAAENNHIAVLKVLIEAGADVNKVESPTRTPLSAAAGNGKIEAMRFLIENRAGINVGETTPLCIAAKKGQIEAMRFLIEHRADINKTDTYGVSPVIAATKSGNTEAVSLLVNLGCHTHLQDYWNKTALDTAREKGLKEIIDILEERILYDTWLKNNREQCVVTSSQQCGTPSRRYTILCNNNRGTIYTLPESDAILYIPKCTLKGYIEQIVITEQLPEYGADIASNMYTFTPRGLGLHEFIMFKFDINLLHTYDLNSLKIMYCDNNENEINQWKILPNTLGSSYKKFSWCFWDGACYVNIKQFCKIKLVYEEKVPRSIINSRVVSLKVLLFMEYHIDEMYTEVMLVFTCDSDSCKSKIKELVPKSVGHHVKKTCFLVYENKENVKVLLELESPQYWDSTGPQVIDKDHLFHLCERSSLPSASFIMNQKEGNRTILNHIIKVKVQQQCKDEMELSSVTLQCNLKLPSTKDTTNNQNDQETVENGLQFLQDEPGNMTCEPEIHTLDGQDMEQNELEAEEKKLPKDTTNNQHDQETVESRQFKQEVQENITCEPQIHRTETRNTEPNDSDTVENMTIQESLSSPEALSTVESMAYTIQIHAEENQVIEQNGRETEDNMPQIKEESNSQEDSDTNTKYSDGNQPKTATEPSSYSYQAIILEDNDFQLNIKPQLHKLIKLLNNDKTLLSQIASDLQIGNINRIDGTDLLNILHLKDIEEGTNNQYESVWLQLLRVVKQRKLKDVLPELENVLTLMKFKYGITKDMY